MKNNKQIAWCILYLIAITICFSESCKEPVELKVQKTNKPSWSSSVDVLYAINKKSDVRCVIYDENMNPIGLQDSYYSTPPMDKITFHLDDKHVIVKSSKCWIIEE